MFSTPQALHCLSVIDPYLRIAVVQLDDLSFPSARHSLGLAQEQIFASRTSLSVEHGDAVYDELFILEVLLNAHIDYVRYWTLLLSGSYGKSWIALQDFQDHLRILFRFLPSITQPKFLKFIEKQSAGLEKLYPFAVFCSIGGLAGTATCSICGKPINSFECDHIAGNLYRGRIAQGLVSSFSVREVSLTTNPLDKRCVLQLNDDAVQFSLVRHLSELINSPTLTPLQFDSVQFRDIPVTKKELAMVQRNDKCPCGSGDKFKKCCIDKTSVTKKHVDIVQNSETGQCFRLQLPA